MWLIATGNLAVLAAGKSDFRSVLETDGIGVIELAQFAKGSRVHGVHWEDDWDVDDWRLVTRILHRLQQFPDNQLVEWTRPAEPQKWWAAPADYCGQLCKISARVESLETVRVPPSPGEPGAIGQVYRCRFSSGAVPFSGVLITRQVPRAWHSGHFGSEPVRLRGVLLQTGEDQGEPSALLVADRLAWYPAAGVRPGLALLAQHGMDVALYDEVLHGQTFVGPERSREGEAFYACLAALGRVNRQDLVASCRETIAATAEKWRSGQDGLLEQLEMLRGQIAAVDTAEARQALEKEEAALRHRRTVGAAVVRMSKQGQSSLGPMILQPESEVGALVRIEGVARRAVRIAVPEHPKIGEYFEIEVFAPESKLLEHQPVVCCVNRLPSGFPQGDTLREHVSVSGVFFKSWRYRTRRVLDAQGTKLRQRQVVTPLLLADMPIWIQPGPPARSQWGLWGGIAFLVFLLALWLNVARMAGRDRRARRALRGADLR
ncbi:MAG: hypothetical protein MK171_09620 [Pirellulales bacterium]|nr:hypothetical protein [Pirellulales bacterium]